MQISRFPTREKLMEMTMETLRNLDVQTQDEEKLLQEVIDIKYKNSIIIEEIKIDDVPDIKTPEEETKWQEILDGRRKEARKRMGLVDESTIVVKDLKEEELVREIKKIDEQILELKPFCQYCNSKGVRHKKECTRPLIVEE